MSGSLLRGLYVLVLILETVLLRGLDLMNLRRLREYADKPPWQIDGAFDSQNYRASIEYSRERQWFSLARGLIESLIIGLAVYLLLPGKLEAVINRLSFAPLIKSAFLVVSVGLLFSLVEVGFSLYSQFIIEERHGFNRMSIGLFWADRIKGLGIGLAIGLPLLIFLLWSVDSLGSGWWLYGFALTAVFQLAVAVLFPVLIIPLFYHLTPVEEGPLKERLVRLAEKCGFSLKAIQVMDGSRRSGHSNAFITGLGSNKRIALFDTLLESLSDEQIEAVVAHEIGHAKLKHTLTQLLVSFLILFVSFALLSLLLEFEPLYRVFGFSAPGGAALLVIMLFFSDPVTTWFTPLSSYFSRRREFAADAFAQDVSGSCEPLVEGLRTLGRDNRTNPVPHRWYSIVHYSHPPVRERIAAMEEREKEQRKKGETRTR